MERWLECIDELKSLLDRRPDIAAALTAAIRTANIPEATIADYFGFLTRILTEVPTQRTMSPATEKFHYIVNCSPDDLLQKDETFQQWLDAFARDHGHFLDSVKSAEALETFIADPKYRTREYDPGPGGWMTFNQFFARKVKPGNRPVAGPCDDGVIVAATDSVYLGCWPIDEAANVKVKGSAYPIGRLLEGSSYADAFSGGIFTHSYLDVNDYHRYHVPVGGVIRKAQIINDRVFVRLEKGKDGSYITKDEIGFQFRQCRGFVVIDSPVGLVAAIPVGMGHVSSVNFTAETGTCLRKGDEFGYFAYGGSDMILLFQRGEVELTATPGVHYKQGEKIGRWLRGTQ